MENIKKNYKLKLCTYYKNGKCYKNKDECNYAHGKDDLRVFEKECNFGLKCFKEDCIFKHPEGWDCKNNGFHTNNDNYEIENGNIEGKKKENNKNIDVNNKDVDNDAFTNVEIFVDGVEINNSDNILSINEDIKDINKCKIDEDNHDKVLNYLNEMQKIYEDFSKKIKNRIDKDFINDKYNYSFNIKIELNNIMSHITLLRNNYEDSMNILRSK